MELAEGVGFDRDYVVSTTASCPATRFAVDAYVHLVRERTPPGGDRLLADRDVLAADHRRARRRHAGATTRHAGKPSHISTGGHRRRRATPTSPSPMSREHARTPERSGGAGGPGRSNATFSGRSSTPWISPMSRRACPAGRLASGRRDVPAAARRGLRPACGFASTRRAPTLSAARAPSGSSSPTRRRVAILERSTAAAERRRRSSTNWPAAIRAPSATPSRPTSGDARRNSRGKGLVRL